MGLAASQGRYLCLTARMSDLVYEGQQISQQRLALAQETSAAAEEYNEALSNKVMQANILIEDGENESIELTYEVITSKDIFAGLGMRIVDLDGNVVVPKKAYTLEVTSGEGDEASTQKYSSAVEFITAHMQDLTSDEANEMGSWGLDKIVSYYQENYPDSTLTLNLVSNVDESLKNENEKFLFDENCTDPKYLQEMISSGQWLIQQAEPSSEEGWKEMTWQGSTRITEVLDTTDDAAAEAKYEASMKDLQSKDKLLELRLENIQTEESAVETEIDSIKEVIGKNIEDSFGTFA